MGRHNHARAGRFLIATTLRSIGYSKMERIYGIFSALAAWFNNSTKTASHSAQLKRALTVQHSIIPKETIMKKNSVMKFLMGISIIAWSTFAFADDQIQSCPIDLQTKADQAYIEYFPLLENGRAYQAAGMGLAWGKAHPTNTINHNTLLLDHTFDTVVGPNNDTLYSEWTLDLSAGPVYIEMPYIDPAKRYSSILMLDSMHYEVGVTVNPSGKIMFVRSGTNYTVPKDVSEVYKFNSDLNMMLHRTEVIDNNDLNEVIALQRQMKITAPIHRNMDEIYPALDADFVSRANSLLKGTTLSEANAKNSDCYKEIGILSDRKIDKSILDKAVENGQAWMKANESKFETAYFNSEENAPKKNHQTGRALANYVWHLAFQPKHADYPNIEFDAEGKRLHGDKVYILTFDKDLPVNAFWSMTTYILATKHFVPNEEKLYKVGDKTAVLNPDGKTITITYSAERPKDSTNWMPTPKGEEFYIGVRMYEAKKEWLDGEYKLPVPVEDQN